MIDKRKQIFIPSDEDIKTQTALIGEFIIKFERICAIIRHTILIVCYPDFSKRQNINMETLLEGLTSDPLRKKLESLIYDNFIEQEDFYSLGKKLSDKFCKMIAIRNSIAHGSMMPGYNSFDGILSSDSFLLKHCKTTKRGVDLNSMIININTIEKLIMQLGLINQAYTNVTILIEIFGFPTSENRDKSRMHYLQRLKESIEKIGSIELKYDNKISK